MHYIFEHLGGFQCRNHILRAHADGKPEKEKSQEEWEFGFDFIEGHGPRDNTRNRMLRCRVTKEVNKPDAPVYKWPPVLVEEEPFQRWCPRPSSFPMATHIIRPRSPILASFGSLIVPSLQEKTIDFHGEPGAGKPLLHALL